MDQSVIPSVVKTFELPPLPFALDSLEPFMSAECVDLLYNGYHTAYVISLNGSLSNLQLPTDNSLTALLGRSSSLGVGLQTYLAGHYNLSLFWKTLRPWADSKPDGILNEAIQVTFGGLKALMNQFTMLTHQVLQDGWIWLVSRDGRLLLVTTTGHRNPLMDGEPANQRGIPILGLNLWKHAYFETFENRLADYTMHWWQHINWGEVEDLYYRSL